MENLQLSTAQVIFFITFFIIAWGYAAYILAKHWKRSRNAQPYQPQTSTGMKIKSVLINVVLQKKVLRNPVRGIFHVFIFFGFLAYSLHTVSQFIAGFTGTYSFYIPSLLGENFSMVYENILDLFTLLVLAGSLYFFFRRYLFKAPELDRPSPVSIVILSLISVLMLFTILETSAKSILDTSYGVTFLRKLTVPLIENASNVSTLFSIGWWGHVVSVLIFLMYIPNTKHAHLIWAPLNYWLIPGGAKGKMPDLDVENATVWGAASVHEFTWKNHLDGLSCIECGRCQLACPASRTGKVLSPKKIMVDIKHSLQEKMPVYELRIKEGKTPQEISESGECRILDTSIARDEIWSCTSCYACVEACPVGNNQLEPILQMRRSVVLNEGAMPSQLQSALTNIENQSNPWGISPETRELWAEGLNIPTMRDMQARGETPDVLYWVGCAGAYDDRNKKIARAFSGILQKAGINFAILGKEESCTGDSARRAGNEYLFQTLASANVDLLNQYNVKKIVTPCPHCFNTLKNEYPTFGGNYEVYHHSEFISNLAKEGKIKFKNSGDSSAVTYHDSCYLGRYNEKYDEPRNVLTLSGKSIVEPSEFKDRAMCCGAGGAQMWMEEMGKERVNLARTRDLLHTGSKTLATACPFCITMIGDAVKSEGLSESHSVMDIAEIISREQV